jgi:hypothetical protein
MDKATRVIGNHAFFVREGDTSTSPSGNVSKSLKPDANDASWIDLGIIEEAGIEPQSEKKEVWAPSPGQLRLAEIIEVKRGLKLKFTVKEMSALMFELMFGTLALTSASTQYNPLEGSTKKGWLKVQQYDHGDALVNTIDVYAHLAVASEVKLGDDVATFEVEATVLHSILNTGTLA